MAKILVTGGAGYIGSHTVRVLKAAGHEVVIFDNLSSGHLEAVQGYQVVRGDLADISKLEAVFADNKFTGVVHFAGSIEAGESMTDPQRFFQNNVVNGLNLLNSMLKHGVKNIVFSSSAAVYGNPVKIPIKEDAPKNPTNYYGLTKLMFEQILESYDHAYGIKSVSLRYFNAAGADPSGEIGDDHKNKTHLITLALLTALSKRDSISIFGTDFPTKDGTGVRDYIHVNDLADAHVLALNYLAAGKPSDVFNLGSERGSSVRDIIKVTKEITGNDFKVIEASRREGDPAELIASSEKARKILGWNPKVGRLEEIIRTAWVWQKSNPCGYTIVGRK